MDDLADVVSTAVGRPKASNPPKGAGIVRPEEQMPDTTKASLVGTPAEAIASAPNTPAAQQAVADLKRFVAEGGATPDESPFGDLSAVVSEAMTKTETSTAKASVIPTATQPAEVTSEPGKLESMAAGAGKAFGSGVLAVQQLAGKGIGYAGDVLDSETLKGVGNWLATDAAQGAKKLAAENAPYEKANPKSNIGGQVVGVIANPVNKLVPMGGPATSLLGAAVKGGAQGAALNVLTSPVTDENQPFLTEKLKQAGVGTIGGVAGGVLGYTLSAAINKGIDAAKRAVGKLTGTNAPVKAEEIVTKTLTDAGVDQKAVTPELFNGLKQQAADAIASGKGVDPKALTRLVEAQTLPVPVPMLKGQITRDPMQFAKEKNLRGITGVGEPITETLGSQNKALISNLDALGATGAPDVVSAGKAVADSLKAADAKAQTGVRAAYQAFKDATGKELDVPLKGLAQDYARILEERGPNIPAAVRSKMESYGLLSGQQAKTFTITDAENLIKNYINKNYDPSNRPVAGALDELRQAVQKSITEGAGSSAEGTAAAELAKAAREAASQRFKAIDSTPALKAAIGGMEPDKFIQKFVLQGNKAEIKNLMGSLDPQAVQTLQASIMGHIKNQVLNKQSAEAGSFSQAQLKNFVSDPNMSARLAQVLGPEKMAVLKQLNRVAENALYAPTASAVNTSNTAAAAANLIKEEVQGGAANRLLDLTKNVPGLSTASQMAQQGVQSKKAAALIDEAVNPSLSKQGGATSLQDLSSLGARGGAAYTGQKRKSR